MMPFTAGRIVAQALSVASLLVTFGVSVTVLIVALSHRQTTRRHMKQGAIVATVYCLLSLPGMFASAFWLDPARVMPSIDPRFGLILRAAIVVGSVAGALLAATLMVVKIPVAVMIARGRPSFPLLLRQDRPWKGWWLAAGLGVVAAVASTLGFRLLGVQLSEDLRRALQVFRDVDWKAPSVLLGIGLPTALAAAIGEEVFYRGIIQAWLARKLAGVRWGVAASIVITTALWAMAHSLNTDSMNSKLGQIVALGLAFGAIARRYGVEASTIAHLSLNLVVVILSLLLPAQP